MTQTSPIPKLEELKNKYASTNPLKWHILEYVSAHSGVGGKELLAIDWGQYNHEVTGAFITCVYELLEAGELKAITFLLKDGKTKTLFFPANTQILDLEDWKEALCD